MILDPYKVLGVTPQDSNDDIKKAYRKLSRIYHPDANVNNPNKEKAEEKFKEIQMAYNQIMKQREGGVNSEGGFHQGPFGYNPYGSGAFSGYGSSYSSTQGNYQGYEQEDSNEMKAAINYINAGYYKEAFTVLESVKDRNAKWYYYQGLAHAGVGNNINALNAARQAVQMEPNNMQYRAFLFRLERGGDWYQGMGSSYGRTPNMSSSVCSNLCWLCLVCNCCFTV